MGNSLEACSKHCRQGKDLEAKRFMDLSREKDNFWFNIFDMSMSFYFSRSSGWYWYEKHFRWVLWNDGTIINIQNTININQYQSQPIHNQFTRQHPEVFLKKVHPLMTSRPEIGVDLQPRPTPGSCKACMRLKISAIYIYRYIDLYENLCIFWLFFHVFCVSVD